MSLFTIILIFTSKKPPPVGGGGTGGGLELEKGNALQPHINSRKNVVIMLLRYVNLLCQFHSDEGFRHYREAVGLFTREVAELIRCRE